MSNPILKNRKGIRKEYAESFLLLTLLSFAASVALTRLFLELTGYPQIGNAELHVAHVLWGGLLLFASTLVMMIYANRWAYRLGAILSGVGVGLFIDEVGKFITQSNDYFYPAAAPIIYAIFLLTVLLFVRVKRPKSEDARTHLYYVLEDLKEVVDQDLNDDEQKELCSRLDSVIASESQPNYQQLATALKSFVVSKTLYIAPKELPPWDRFMAAVRRIENNWFTRKRMKTILITVMAALSAWTIFYPVSVMLVLTNAKDANYMMQELLSHKLVRDMTGLSWFQARVGLEGSIGLIIFIAAILLIFRKEKVGINVAYIGLIISLTVVNLMLFYFDQFSTIVNAICQFMILLMVLRYRKRFIREAL